MSKKSIDNHYKDTAPLSMVELKKVLGNHPFNHAISEDACCMYGKTLSDLTWDQVCIVNAAINLGVMTAKRLERSKKQSYGDAMGLLQRVEDSVGTWEKLDESELLDLIKELKGIARNDARWEIKEQLLQFARKIYQQKFIQPEI